MSTPSRHDGQPAQKVLAAEPGQPSYPVSLAATDGRELPRWPAALGVGLTLVGLGLASYLTWAHYQPNPGSALACSTGGVVDCSAVTTSSYSTVAHVPVALAGLIFFVPMLALQLPAAWRAKSRWVHRARLAWAGIGTLSVFWLVYVELIKLDKICEYCTGVHIVTIALFAVSALGSASVGTAAEWPHRTPEPG